jgi:two-component system, NarL family, nitrate/nitrite response regulator NarL
MAAGSIDCTTASRLQADTTSRMKPTFTTALLCDNALLRTGLEAILSGSPFVLAEIVFAASPRLADRVIEPPALVIAAANQFSGRMAEVIRQAREHFPQARIVALADQFDPGSVRQAYEAGADGLCQTTAGREALITSLELVMLGAAMVPVALIGAMLSEQPSSSAPPSQSAGNVPSLSSDLSMHKLSPREAEILRCLMQGDANKVIARKCDVTEATIKVHVKAILRKIGASNRTQAAMWASQRLTQREGASVHG